LLSSLLLLLLLLVVVRVFAWISVRRRIRKGDVFDGVVVDAVSPFLRIPPRPPKTTPTRTAPIACSAALVVPSPRGDVVEDPEHHPLGEFHQEHPGKK